MTYSNLQIFTVELIGTFILVIFATGSIVLDAEMFNGELGIPFAAVAPFVALLIGVYSFGKVSLAHFNPAVTNTRVIVCFNNNWRQGRFGCKCTKL